ncbi:MAG: hypothetical protein QOF53_329 [Nocardioidaceae bacterium]|nr:hypothetical protein [Nocardioidaceae bacterium]
MTNGPHIAPPRRLGAALLTILCLLAPALLSQAVPGPSSAAGAQAAAYDHQVHAADCDLLGRVFEKHLGCSRTHCEEGAVLWRRTYGAEACALRRAPKGFGFVATVDVRECKALNRKWISQVNYCASEPDRTTDALYNAPQCTGAATVYVTLQETEGFYDECLTLDRAAELVHDSVLDHLTLQQEVSLRSATQCPYRPGQAFVNGVCAPVPGFQPVGGGTVMIGDSLTWRGSDELGRLRRTFTIDGEPARPPTELASRLAHYRAGHGQPAGLIIELGTVPARTFGRSDLVRAVRSVPKRTKVMLVLPYYVLQESPLVVTPQSRKVDGWMRALAQGRSHTCVADWPAYVRAHDGILQDGVHTKHGSEGRWAHWISQQWSHC